MSKLKRFFDSKYFFIAVFLLIAVYFVYTNSPKNLNKISSDVWMYQYVTIQQEEGGVWDDVPPLFNQEKFYLAYPILYHLNPGLDHGMSGYFILAFTIFALTYLINGWVIKKVFGSWALATLGAVLVLVTRYIFPTRMGALGFGNMRGVGLVFPFYLLLSHYWIIEGIKHKYKNIFLAVIAAITVYLYPPTGVIIIPFFIIAAFLVRGKKYAKQIGTFAAIYLLVSSVFWYGHFTNPYSGQVDINQQLTAEELSLQAEIVDYRVSETSIIDTDFGVLKRSIWDDGPLIIVILLTFLLLRRFKDRVTDRERMVHRINVWFGTLLLSFIAVIEVINAILRVGGRPPFFIEHLRLMRGFGFLIMMEAALFIYLLYKYTSKKKLAVAAGVFLVFYPLSFTAPLVRGAVRALVPVPVREKYNLAPVVPTENLRSFENLQSAAFWARENLDHETTKVFTFDDFKFKVASRLETNKTVKEGALFYSSGFDNSKRWYDEIRKYDEIKDSEDFNDVVEFARSLGSTHLLLPRGDRAELYKESEYDFPVVYINKDYRLLKLE